MTKDIRTRILDAAVHLLETEGAKAFGQTRVARAAGVKQGNITYHFPKKSDLVAAVVAQVNEQRARELDLLATRARELAPAQVVELLVARLPSFLLDTKRARVMLAILIEAERDPALANQLAEVNLKQRATMAALLGRAADDIDLELMFATISGLSLFYTWALPSDGERVHTLLRRFGDWLPRLLSGPDASPAASHGATPRAETPRVTARPRAAAKPTASGVKQVPAGRR